MRVVLLFLAGLFLISAPAHSSAPSGNPKSISVQLATENASTAVDSARLTEERRREAAERDQLQRHAATVESLRLVGIIDSLGKLTATQQLNERRRRAEKDADAAGLILTLVNAALLALALLPVGSFRSVRERLLNFRLTNLDRGGGGQERNAQQQALARDLRRLHHLFDRHGMAFREFKGLKRAFMLVFVIAAIPILGLTLFPLRWNGEQISWGLLTALGVEAAILLGIERLYALPPHRLQSIVHLVAERNIAFHPLVNGMQLHLGYNPTVDITLARQMESDPLRLTLSTSAKVFGFRFLCVVHNARDEVFFISYGPVTGLKDLTRHLQEPDPLQNTEINILELGRGQFNLIPEAQTLTIRLFVFMSVFPSEELAPLFTQGDMQVHGAGSEMWALGGSAGGFDIRTDRRYGGLRFSGAGTIMKELRWTTAADEVVRRIIDRFGQSIQHSRVLVSNFSLEGDLLS